MLWSTQVRRDKRWIIRHFCYLHGHLNCKGQLSEIQVVFVWKGRVGKTQNARLQCIYTILCILKETHYTKTRWSEKRCIHLYKNHYTILYKNIFSPSFHYSHAYTLGHTACPALPVPRTQASRHWSAVYWVDSSSFTLIIFGVLDKTSQTSQMSLWALEIVILHTIYH